LPVRSDWAGYLANHPDTDRISKQIRAIESLECDGATVLAAPADVADVAQMRAVVAEAKRRFGRIDGVVHAAGVPGGGIIQLKDSAEAARVLAPKVAGTEALAQALGDTPLDFMILCSSMTSLVGGGGQVDYCAANAYLDAFADAYARQTATFAVSLNWDAWQQVGMAVETNVPEHLARRRAEILRHAILPAEGAEAFQRVLGSEAGPQVLITPLPLPTRVAPALDAETGGTVPVQESTRTTPMHGRPVLSTEYVAPDDDIERAIADIWQQLLAISPIGIHDDFFELGGHSLLALGITTRLRDGYGLELSLADFFQAPSVGQLAMQVRRASAVSDREEIEII